MRAKKGFTLVEILIVVVILGILAAIVIPQFAGASTEAKESSLVSNLQSIRSQIELFKVQHNDLIPGETLTAAGAVTTPTAELFVRALCEKTNQYGEVGTTAEHKFGPYMKKLPVNPFSNAPDTVITVAVMSEAGSSVDVGGSKITTGNGGNETGWYFVCTDRDNTDYGLFQARDPLENPTDGTDHVDY